MHLVSRDGVCGELMFGVENIASQKYSPTASCGESTMYC